MRAIFCAVKKPVSERTSESRSATHVVAVKVDELEGRVDWRRALGAIALEDEDEVGEEELRDRRRSAHDRCKRREASTPRRKASKAAQPA